MKKTLFQKYLKSFCIVALVVLPSLFTSCSCRNNKIETANPQWYQYINAHTTGQISKEDSIRVVFNENLIKEEEVGKNADDIFDISPGIDGKAEWGAPNMIVFVPDEDIPSGKRYKVTLDLDDYIDKAKDLDDFFFYFESIRQDFDITFNGFRFPNENDSGVAQYHGTLNTADTVKTEALKDVLEAEQDGKDLKITWTGKGLQKQHPFIIENIVRKDKPSTLSISWDGDDISVDKEGKIDIEVLAKGVFRVVDVKPVMGEEQYVSIIFSDPLLKTQDLRGMLKLSKGTVRTMIDNNVVRVYPQEKIEGETTVEVSAGISNTEGKKISENSSHRVLFESIKPAVRFVGKGTILPENDKLTIPFEAVNVKLVQVTAFEIYSKNMAQFFQVNNYTGSNELARVGRYLWRKTITLNATPEETSQWKRYSLDVTELFSKHPDSMLRLTLSINRGNSVYSCPGVTTEPVVEKPFVNTDDSNNVQSSYWDTSEENYYYYDNDNWENRSNPCHDAYYQNTNNKISASKNFISSNIGIIAKIGEDKVLNVVTTDIRTAKPLSAKITVYNHQNMPVGECKTNSSGMGVAKLSGVPFFLMAEKDAQKGYLKLSGDASLMMSHFDVAGQTVKDGVKGFIYGERGVWRPGDEMYLTFVLEDKGNLIPDNHPVVLELYNPSRQLVKTSNEFTKEGDFYAFKIRTDENDPTGNWQAVVKLGGLEFSKVLKIETVVPNRLRINLQFSDTVIHKTKMPINTKLFAEWLHGGTASGLAADMTVKLTPRDVSFTRYKDYTFNDITREYNPESAEIYSGYLDENGNSEFSIDIPVNESPAGMLEANFLTRVFEENGGYSIETYQAPFHPYGTYVGIQTPRGDDARGMLLTDTKHKLRIATVDSYGNPVSVKNLNVKLYKIKWRYWWEKTSESLADYTGAESTNEIATGTVSSVNGVAEWEFMVKYPDWGRYLVRVSDVNGGHASSKIVYIDWPGWAGRAREEQGGGASTLNFVADKSSYKVGEKAVIYIPEAEQGAALVSIENGTRVIDSFWVDTQKGKNKFNIKLTRDMSPNVYVNITLLQPHKDKKNDGPIRLYGVIPLIVEDPETQLEPVLKSPDEFRPAQTSEFSVSEKNGKEMTYTVAIVDEGLLGLTRFKTPDLRSEFYRREALGIRTWDLFDDVVGAYGAQLERIIALGGDEELEEKNREKDRRFPPVVKFMGPFKLGSGDTNKHKVDLPQYVGSVKIMVVCGNNGAYGSTEKSVAVRQPLMMLATLPRVIGAGETITIPVSIITTDDKIKGVNINLSTDDMLKPMSGSVEKLSFSRPGEKVTFFNVKAADVVGKTKIVLTATSGENKAVQTVVADIRSANPLISKTEKSVIAPGKTWKTRLVPHGLENTNDASIELSTMPPINLENRLESLIQYPHGCIEQTVSSAFPQLYLGDLMQLSSDDRKRIENNVKACIDRLRKFQLSNGGFSYWPGSSEVCDWGTNYGYHFVLEAKEKGYYVPAEMLKSLRKYQQNAANSWKYGIQTDMLTQASRLYTLALAKSPELGVMNRLRESKDLDTVSAWLLASAYKLAGQDDAARSIVQNRKIAVNDYRESGGTFGSGIRDRAIILIGMSHLDQRAEAKGLAEELAGYLSTGNWYSTQELGYSLVGLSKFIGNSGTSYKFECLVTINGVQKKYKSSTPLLVVPVSKLQMQGIDVEIKNLESSATLYTMLTSRGSPASGMESASSKGLNMNVSYTDVNGNPVDISSVKQGKDIIAKVTIENQTGSNLENIALNFMTPSGYQIRNARFELGEGSSGIDYQDYKDDRVYSYFSLKAGESKSLKISINASFVGKYYSPAVSAEVMYNADIHSIIKGRWITISK